MTDAPILGPVNFIADLDAAGDFEKKHTPHVAIDVGDTPTIHVTVGYGVPHPNQPDHYITWIEILVESAQIARFDLSPVVTDPTVSVAVSLEPGTVLRVISHCNLHGLWAAEVTL